jgi:DNA-binding XRE family transcriptional regulator
MALVTNMREYRAKKNLTQDDLAALVGVRRETIVNLEKGRYNPSLKLAMDIAKVFSCTVEDLFYFQEDATK